MKRLPLSGWIGLIIVASVVLLALVSLVWTPYNPVHAVPADRLLASSSEHLMGTDRYGRDVFSRIMAGAQITLFVGLVAVGISALVGVPWGMWAGMKRGWTEATIMRGMDIMLAFPALLLAIITGAVFGSSTTTAMVAIGIAGIPGFARVARAGTLQVMTQDYVASARVSRVPTLLIAIRHVLPNIAGLIVVQASVAFALAVLAEAALSFLGLGTAPPDPSWGRMLQSAQASLGTAPQLALWPGLAIAITVLGFNLLGDGLSDALNPRRSRR
ncbi:ABC transporter permease [Corynebacterium testudinoris]|uniref:ABC-type dipeptide/oligopeptide/nickel transport system, permease component n=1 Tax=Corynebacterium testudinoris TaxID=136857 RepID=A0A0G3HBN8_9CORY|nr:ABC transporter permease [Corynebacterium testudinoris]AKK09363.1 ABC-type dipeptide/oligopeptide/nickel transport system, permease component [Corynebacterium testudinoris]MBX8995284.1 ABC transporter permease [Corynebacterium testudinoris]